MIERRRDTPGKRAIGVDMRKRAGFAVAVAALLCVTLAPAVDAQALDFVDIDVRVTTTGGEQLFGGDQFPAGTPLVFSVTVSPRVEGGAAPTGTVSITDSTTSFGDLALAPGGTGSTATGEIVLPEGDLLLFAEYSGDAAYEGTSQTIGDVRIVGRAFTELFVTRVYDLLLDRAPDPAGLAFYTDLLLSGVPRAEVAGAIAGSPESTYVQVRRAYGRILGREPDSGGLEAFAAVLFVGGRLEDVEAHLEASPENVGSFAGHWGEFATYVYFDVGVEDPAGITPPFVVVAPWVALLLEGATPIDVVQPMYGSAEVLEARVEAAYDVFLGRPADAFGGANAMAFLQNGGRSLDLWVGLLSSDEFFGALSLS